MHIPTVGSYGGAVSYERGIPELGRLRWSAGRGAACASRAASATAPRSAATSTNFAGSAPPRALYQVSPEIGPLVGQNEGLNKLFPLADATLTSHAGPAKVDKLSEIAPKS